jgi:membrane protease YdiL (CAAX protease family)
MALPVYGVQIGLERLMRQLPGLGVQEHPLTLLAREGGLSPLDWLGLVLTAMVCAPVWEELFFRGLVQPWAIDRPHGGAVLMGLAVVLGAVLRHEQVRDAFSSGDPRRLALALLPALTALALVPVYLLLRHLCRSAVPAGIFAASVLFGWFHAGVWPSPVALTLLGFGLGWLAWKRRSLVGPFALHAAFNSIACLLLVFEPYLDRALGL